MVSAPIIRNRFLAKSLLDLQRGAAADGHTKARPPLSLVIGVSHTQKQPMKNGRENWIRTSNPSDPNRVRSHCATSRSLKNLVGPQGIEPWSTG